MRLKFLDVMMNLGEKWPFLHHYVSLGGQLQYSAPEKHKRVLKVTLESSRQIELIRFRVLFAEHQHSHVERLLRIDESEQARDLLEACEHTKQ